MTHKFEVGDFIILDNIVARILKVNSKRCVYQFMRVHESVTLDKTEFAIKTMDKYWSKLPDQEAAKYKLELL